MKTSKLFLAVLVLSGNVVATYTLAGANNIPGLVTKDGVVSESHCRMQTKTSTPESFLGMPPLLNVPNSGELIDYYGPCDETPIGQSDLDTQRLDQYGWENNYRR
jgi:hypothetical protein